MGNNTELKSGIIKRLFSVLVVFALQALLLFLAAGTLHWNWAWVFQGIYLADMLINGIIMMRISPETIAERGSAKMTQRWDIIYGNIWGIAQFLLIPIVAGLDKRFGSSPEFLSVWHILGAILVIVGLGFPSWAMVVNAFFSTAVCIQSERGQTVCQSGPYRFVRHPGYLGFNLLALGTALLLGSLWALIPALIAVVAMIIRTSYEDRFLQAQLPGYREFAEKVRYRLIPGFW